MNDAPDIWKKKSSKEIADCRVFKVREDFCERESDKKESTFFVIENPDWVNIIAVTKDDEVVMIEQFRHGTEEIILEIPGGMVDAGEDIERAARRELLEETGYSSENFVYLGKSRPNPALQNNTIHHFLARDAEKNGETNFDEHESVVTRLLPLSDVAKLTLDGKITHSLAIAGFYYLEAYESQNGK